MLRDAILSTLAYYDVLDMPLQAHEAFRYLIKKDDRVPRLAEVVDELARLRRDGVIGEREGFSYLFGREYLVPLRLRRQEFARHKWHRAYWIFRYLRAVPFIRLVFASGSLSMKNTDEQSDLDAIIVARHGRIWTTRLLVAGVLELLGARRAHSDTVAPDKMCPNHFMTDRSLSIPFRSMYTAQLYANLVPVVVTDAGLFQKFRDENSWVLGYLCRWEMDLSGVFEPGLSKAIRKVGEWLLAGRFGNWLERRAARYQRRRIEGRVFRLRPGGHLTYTDNALAFHSGSSEAEILSAYEAHQSQLTR